jgi:cytosine/adenosine deaminase-related metal-dependent hydrolase
MKRFSAQYIITNSGPPIKRGVVTTDDAGNILAVEDTGGKLEEKHSVEFYNGIIVPGFVNCHCHLELSHLKGVVGKGGGIGSFVEKIITQRGAENEKIVSSASSADKEMFQEGISLCADICNSPASFNVKKNSPILYINLLEVFGIDPDKSALRMDEIMKVAEIAVQTRMPYYLVPHAAYSMSAPLLKLLREKSLNNKVTSIHFMESEGEKSFLATHSGPLLTSYEQLSLVPSELKTATSHAEIVLNEITPSGNLILVHNTFADIKTIETIKVRKNLFWCLCPGSNLYIENELPPLDLLIEEGCEIVIGTDSLASNTGLSIIEELKILQMHFPNLTLNLLVEWATINGARALGEEGRFGKIEKGKKPGLVLIEEADLINMKLLPGSFVRRLI